MDVEDSAPSRGSELAQRFELSSASLFQEILNFVSNEEIAEILAPLPSLNAVKVKSKFDEYAVKSFTSQLNVALNEEPFRVKIDLLANLEASTPDTPFTWRPNEQTSSDTLYRPYRVQFLRKDIERIEDRINSEKVKIDANKSILSRLLASAKENGLLFERNNQDIEEACNTFEKEK